MMISVTHKLLFTCFNVFQQKNIKKGNKEGEIHIKFHVIQQETISNIQKEKKNHMRILHFKYYCIEIEQSKLL